MLLNRIIITAWFLLFSPAISMVKDNGNPHELIQEAHAEDRTESLLYRFKDHSLSYKVLSQLDVFKPVPSPFRNESRPFLGLKNDENYCDKHRAFVAEFPDFIFKHMNFIISEPQGSLVRSKIVPSIGNDLYPHLGSDMPVQDKLSFMYDIKPEVNIFFTKNTMIEHKHIGKHYSCLTQISNHIAGNENLSRKDMVARAAVIYARQFKDRPQCFNHDKLFPRASFLSEKASCEAFFNKLNSLEYQDLKKERAIVYIRKIGASSHRGEGVQPVNEQEEVELRRDYENGLLCGQVKKNYVIYDFIHNPLLVNGRKFDFRMFMLIASTNPLLVYYHDGLARVSLSPYSVHSEKKEVLLTNIALNKNIYEQARNGNLFNGMNEETLQAEQQWSLERLQAYLLDKGIIDNVNWLDNYLRPEFKKAMVHLVRVSSSRFLRRSSLYEFYGMDFMLDESLNLWFIEANAGPALDGFSKEMEKLAVKMLKDHFEIVFGLLRSRMKRIIMFVNELIEDGSIELGNEGDIIIQNLEARRAIFEKITENRFEEEFAPKTTNGFSLIINENLKGAQAYQGFITEDCL